MQAFRLVVLTLIGVIIAWFVIMAVDMQLFLNTNVDPTVVGTVAINRTDIDARCGIGYQGSVIQVDYKLNTKGQIVYLCPLGLWPIRDRVVATTITEDLKRTLPPTQLTRITQFYAVPQTSAQVFNPIVQPQPMSANAPLTQPTATTPTQTFQTTTTTTTTPASPAAVSPEPEPLPGAPITPPSPSTPIMPAPTPAQPTTTIQATPNTVSPSEPITIPPSPNPPPLAEPTQETTTTP